MVFIISTKISLEIAVHFPQCITQTSMMPAVILKDEFEEIQPENRDGRKVIVTIDQVREVVNWTREVEKKKGKKVRGGKRKTLQRVNQQLWQLIS